MPISYLEGDSFRPSGRFTLNPDSYMKSTFAFRSLSLCSISASLRSSSTLASSTDMAVSSFAETNQSLSSSLKRSNEYTKVPSPFLVTSLEDLMKVGVAMPLAPAVIRSIIMPLLFSLTVGSESLISARILEPSSNFSSTLSKRISLMAALSQRSMLWMRVRNTVLPTPFME